MDEPHGASPPDDDQRANWVDSALYAMLGTLVVALALHRAGCRPQESFRALAAAVQSATDPRPIPAVLGSRATDPAHQAAFNAFAAAYNRCHELAVQQKYAEALPFADQASGMAPEGLPADARASGYLLRAQVLVALERHDEAISAIGQARSLAPGAPIYEAYATAYFRKQDYRQAVAFGRDFIDSGGKVSPQIYFLVAASHDRLGDVEQASQWIARGRSEFPTDTSLGKLAEKYDREARSERSMTTRHGDRFILKFVDVREQESLRAEILRALDRTYTSASNAFAFVPGEALPVILYPSRGAYYAASGAPQWSAAQYDGKIRIPLPTGTGMPPSLEAVAAHEITHYVIHRIAGDRVPAWLDEGLAQLAEQRDDAWAHEQIARSSRLFSLRELEASFNHFSDPAQARLAYAQALVATRRIVDQQGMPRMRGLLDQLAAGRPSREVLEGVSGLESGR